MVEGIRLSADDLLFIQAWNSLSPAPTLQVRIRYRYLLEENYRVTDTLTVTPTTNRVSSMSAVTIGDNIELISLYIVQTSVNIPARGQTFVAMGIIRSPVQESNKTVVLTQGYIYGLRPLSWQYGSPALFEDPLSGPGFVRTETIAAPGAGNEWTRTIPVNARWHIRTTRLQFAAANAGITRGVNIRERDSAGNVFANIDPSGTQAINSTVLYTWFPGSQFGSAGSDSTAALPINNIMRGNDVIGSFTNNLNVADAYTLIVLEIEEWIDPLS